MEGKEEVFSSAVAPREETHIQFGGSTEPAPAPAPETAPPSSTPATEAGKKKRGRPRKYGPDGKPRLALSPMPISASYALTGDGSGEFSGWKYGAGEPTQPAKRKQKFELSTPGGLVAYSVGANFTPHVMTVNAGEDVNMKIVSFSQQGSRAICVLAANGMISNVTLRQQNTSGGTLTYEGRFEILSLSGSFMPADSGVAKSRSGGMSVSLAGPDGRVIGGGLAGLLIAAGPVQVVIGSFLPGHHVEPKPKKPRYGLVPAFSLTTSTSPPVFGEGTEQAYNDPNSSITPPNPSKFNPESSDATLHGSEPKDPQQSQCVISC